MIEPLILGSLLNNEEFARKVLPFLQEEYFESFEAKLIYRSANDYVKKYNNIPSKDALRYAIEESRSISEEQFKTVTDTIESLSYDDKNDVQWLVDKTEKFCQDRALYNAIRTSISVIDDKNSKIDKGSIPKMLQDALGVSFDNSVGHDFLENVNERYDFYHRKEARIEFDIDLLNTITKGGLPRKSLNMILAGTGVGKSLAMCHFAATNLMHGKNVLYITLEMSEERIAERIDANLLDASIDQIHDMPKDVFEKKINRLKTKTPGKLIVKEYPTASAGSAHFRHLLNELKLKKNFIPDIIYIDYLNICMSSRLKNGANVNSYMYVKAIAEELRGLAVEFNVPLVSATQTTRSGYCLDLKTTVITPSGTKTISDVVVGDEVLSNSGWNTVKTVFPTVKKRMYRITTESGREIVCSADHLFPTEDGEKNIKSGLCLKDKLFINKSEV